MLGSIAKIIGLTITSLSGGLTTQKTKENRELTRAYSSYALADSDNLVNTEDYWTSGYQQQQSGLLPTTFNRSKVYIKQTENFTASLAIIENAYWYGNTQTQEQYYTTYQDIPETFVMVLLKVQPRTNAIVNAYFDPYITLNNQQWQERGTTETEIIKYTAIYNEASDISFWNSTAPLTREKELETNEGRTPFNLGSNIYQRLMESEIQYQRNIWWTYDEIPSEINTEMEQPPIDYSNLNIPVNTNGYYIYLIKFTNENNRLQTTNHPTSIIDWANIGYNFLSIQVGKVT